MVSKLLQIFYFNNHSFTLKSPVLLKYQNHRSTVCILIDISLPHRSYENKASAECQTQHTGARSLCWRMIDRCGRDQMGGASCVHRRENTRFREPCAFFPSPGRPLNYAHTSLAIHPASTHPESTGLETNRTVTHRRQRSRNPFIRISYGS